MLRLSGSTRASRERAARPRPRIRERRLEMEERRVTKVTKGTRITHEKLHLSLPLSCCLWQVIRNACVSGSLTPRAWRHLQCSLPKATGWCPRIVRGSRDYRSLWNPNYISLSCCSRACEESVNEAWGRSGMKETTENVASPLKRIIRSFQTTRIWKTKVCIKVKYQSLKHSLHTYSTAVCEPTCTTPPPSLPLRCEGRGEYDEGAIKGNEIIRLKSIFPPPTRSYKPPPCSRVVHEGPFYWLPMLKMQHVDSSRAGPNVRLDCQPWRLLSFCCCASPELLGGRETAEKVHLWSQKFLLFSQCFCLWDIYAK